MNGKQQSIELSTLPLSSAVPLALHRAGVRKQFRRFSLKLKKSRWEPKLRSKAKTRVIHQKDSRSIMVRSPKTLASQPRDNCSMMMSWGCIFKTGNNCRRTGRRGREEKRDRAQSRRAQREAEKSCGIPFRIYNVSVGLDVTQPWKTDTDLFGVKDKTQFLDYFFLRIQTRVNINPDTGMPHFPQKLLLT